MQETLQFRRLVQILANKKQYKMLPRILVRLRRPDKGDSCSISRNLELQNYNSYQQNKKEPTLPVRN